MARQLGEFGTALEFRDLITQLVKSEVDKMRPRQQYGTVLSIDRPNYKATVAFIDSPTDPIPVSMGTIQPYAVGQRVRIGGPPGDRYIEDVIGQPHIYTLEIDSLTATGVTATSITASGTTESQDLIVTGYGSVSRGYLDSAVSRTPSAAITTVTTVVPGLGDILMQTVLGRKYEVITSVALLSSVASDLASLRLLDGGSSAPTNASPTIARKDVQLSSTAGRVESGLLYMSWRCVASPANPGEIAAGSHRIGIFVLRTGGTGNITAGNGAIDSLVIAKDIGD